MSRGLVAVLAGASRAGAQLAALGGRSRSACDACSTSRSRAREHAAARAQARSASSMLSRHRLRLHALAPTLARPMPRHFLTGAELTAAELDALLDRALELKARAALLARARRAQRRADLREALDAHARCPSRSASTSSAATRWCCAPTSCSSRAARRCATPRSCSPATSPRSGCAPGPTRRSRSSPRTAPSRSSTCSAARHHPCQALADLLTLREAYGALDGPAPRLRRRRQQRRPLARAARRARGHARRGRLARRATRCEDDLALPAGATGSLTLLRATRARRCAGAQRRLHRRVGEHGRRGDRRRAPRGARRLPRRRRAARRRRARARSRCTTCPRTPARRSPPRSSTARASASGTRPRTAATRRRRCSSCCSTAPARPCQRRR